MKKLAITTLTAAGIAAATIGLAAGPASAAPSGAGSVQDTVDSLQANGYKVILNKTGAAPLDQCTVTSIRPGQRVTQPTTRDGGSLVQHVLYTTVYVDLLC